VTNKEVTFVSRANQFINQQQKAQDFKTFNFPVERVLAEKCYPIRESHLPRKTKKYMFPTFSHNVTEKVAHSQVLHCEFVPVIGIKKD
jgi:hypothetical protein